MTSKQHLKIYFKISKNHLSLVELYRSIIRQLNFCLEIVLLRQDLFKMSKRHLGKDESPATTWRHIVNISERHLNLDDLYQFIFRQLNFVQKLFYLENVCLRCLKEIFRKMTIKKHREDVSFRFLKTSCYKSLILNIFQTSLSLLWIVLHKKIIFKISKYHPYKVDQLPTSSRFVATIS